MYSYCALRRYVPSVQDLGNRPYLSATFVDDFWLVLVVDARAPLMLPELVFLDTNQTTIDGGELAQTTFYLDHYQHGNSKAVFVSDLGGHGPSCEDDTFAPFYPDASHRLLVIEFMGTGCLFVMKTEALLRLAREREGEELQWGEWKAHVTRISTDVDTRKLWVSGPRLCLCTSPNLGKRWWMCTTSARKHLQNTRKRETMEL